MSPIAEILEQARWAPSGDNTQVWRFTDLDVDAFTVVGRDLRHEMVYDIDGRPSQMSLGALLESIRIAASAFGLAVEARHIGAGSGDMAWRLVLRQGASADALAGMLPKRCTNRRSFSTAPLPPEAWRQLQAACPGYLLQRFASWRERWRAARVCAGFGRIRYASRECWRTHREVVDFTGRAGAERMPAASLGCGWMVGRLMRWALQSWGRQDFLNRWCGGTILPSLQFDLLPTLRCGAFVVAIAKQRDDSLNAQLAAGAAFQRLWLTATSLGLALQPAFSPIIFSDYARQEASCFEDPRLLVRARGLAQDWDGLLGGNSHRAVFAARLGYATAPAARAGRLSVEQLMRPWSLATGRQD